VLLYLINPRNSLISLANVRNNRWNRYRIWKPLGLLVLASATPPQWEIKVIDENLGKADYASMPRPDLVGITAFTAQASRAYELATEFRSRSVPVIMGGIHATMRLQEALNYVDSVVTGEAELVWPKVLVDLQNSSLKRIYAGEQVDMKNVPLARHDLLPKGYAFGSIQIKRGCPLNCNFCSVTAFNGPQYRARPIEDVVREFKTIREKLVLVVDDNLIGTSKEHISWAKKLFGAMIAAGIRKKWIAQTTINFADDNELLTLASKAGCRGVFIGFESPTAEGLAEVGKKFNLVKNRDLRDSVRKIKKHNIIVVGSFIIGLDTDKPGIGKQIVEAADFYGIDLLNTMVLTPLPGTRLWGKMETQGRIITNSFPDDWKYYTLTFPVANYKHLSRDDVIRETEYCNKTFYSIRRILSRLYGNFWQRRSPLAAMAANLSYRNNIHIAFKAHRQFNLFGSQEIKYTSESQIRISCLKEKDALSAKYPAQPITQQKNLPNSK
jgi:radical SAM superfamily enzyme YgiQ (UPF0313 family)